LYKLSRDLFESTASKVELVHILVRVDSPDGIAVRRDLHEISWELKEIEADPERTKNTAARIDPADKLAVY
jgi:hypothetical protein